MEQCSIGSLVYISSYRGDSHGQYPRFGAIHGRIPCRATSVRERRAQSARTVVCAKGGASDTLWRQTRTKWYPARRWCWDCSFPDFLAEPLSTPNSRNWVHRRKIARV